MDNRRCNLRFCTIELKPAILVDNFLTYTIFIEVIDE
jgi:hypothetical protein